MQSGYLLAKLSDVGNLLHWYHLHTIYLTPQDKILSDLVVSPSIETSPLKTDDINSFTPLATWILIKYPP